MKKTVLSFIMAAIMCVLFMVDAFAGDTDSVGEIYVNSDLGLDINCRSAILMDAATGTVLYEKNADEALPPASVTKIMTLLLVMEAIDNGAVKLDDMVSVSENAASMGGSQIFLEVGETMSVEDLLKSVIIASANDAAVALAEYVAGSEEAFVTKMNERARELSMNNTCFENTNGLDDTVTRHLTSARDIAIMSRELIKYEKVLQYSSIWMDTVRNGAFGLTNTNRLVRFYNGATGLKTGSTANAKFCVSATAKRDNMHLICVIMGADTRDQRNAYASKLLDYGFANYSLFTAESRSLDEVKVLGGREATVGIEYKDFNAVVGKGEADDITSEIIMDEKICAPILVGDSVGMVVYKKGDIIVGETKIYATENVEKIKFADILGFVMAKMVLK